MKPMKLIAAVGAALLTALVMIAVQTPGASAASVTVIATADTYSNGGAPSTNFGTACCLAVGGKAPYISFIRFVVPANATAASLVLYVGSQTFAGSTSTFQVKQANDTWGEKTLTKNNQPAISSTVLGSFVGGKQNGSITVALSGVTGLAGREVTLALTGGTDELWLWSREHSATTAPTLKVTTAAPSPSPSPSKSTTPTPSPSASATTTPSPSPSSPSPTTSPTVSPTVSPSASAAPSTTPTASLTPSPSPSPAASSSVDPAVGVIGDTLSQGCCDSSGGNVADPYWQVTADQLGWSTPVVNAVAGSGYSAAGDGDPYTARIGPFLDAHPNLQALIVEGGGNDTSDTSVESAAVNSVFDTIQAKEPTLRVYVLGPYSPDSDGEYAAQRGVIQQAAAAHGFAFIDQIAGGWMRGRSDLLSTDGVYPIAAGHDLLGRRLAGAIALLSCKTGCLP